MPTKIAMVAAGSLLVAMFVLAVPDMVFQKSVAQSDAEQKEVIQTRGAQNYEQRQTEINIENRERVAELQRRVAVMENQRVDLDIAVLKRQILELDARLNTVYEFGRIILGAAIIYLVQMVGSAVIWISGKSHIKGHGR